MVALYVGEPRGRDHHGFDRDRIDREGTGYLRKYCIAALKRDEAWIKEHTFYSQRAAAWHSANQADNRLLSGSDIAAAKDWIKQSNSRYFKSSSIACKRVKYVVRISPDH